MRVMVWIFLTIGVYFLAQGFVMPMLAERNDVGNAEFMQMREASSHLGIGMMIGAVACALLDRARGAAGTRSSLPPVPQQYPPQQPYQQPQHPQGGWQVPPQQ